MTNADTRTGPDRIAHGDTVDFDTVANWLADELALRPHTRRKLTPQTRITHDLGVTGDDGQELLVRFCDHFGIPAAATNLDIARHFAPEGFGIVLPALLRRLGLLPRWPTRFHPITVGDLVDAANCRSFHYDYAGRLPS